MMKLYLLGGENIVKRDAREINQRAFCDAGGEPYVLVFSWARASFDRTYKRRKRLFDYFRSLGASNVEFVEYSDAREEIARKIEGSDLLYLTGGLVSALIERLKNKGVDKMLHKYERVVVGRSAGASVLCQKGIVTVRSNSATRFRQGFGLADVTVKVHYKPSKDHELKKLSKEEKIYAIPACSALVCDNGTLSSVGDVYLFQNGEKIIC
jgi:peptidase E